jgi:hypothetical protein
VFEVVDGDRRRGLPDRHAVAQRRRRGGACRRGSGKGFSIVVATEVRSLAQRVGESADEIRSLITLASDQLDFSGIKIGGANQSLDRPWPPVCRTWRARLRQISNASTEQSDTLVSVSQRVGDLDEITRENARMVDESTAAASNTLLERAQILREAVSSMRLRQGSADEARDLLDRALGPRAMRGQEQGFQGPARQAEQGLHRPRPVHLRARP